MQASLRGGSGEGGVGGLSNGRVAILHAVPPSAGPRAKGAADAVLFVRTYLSQGMEAVRDLTQAGNGNRKGLQYLHPRRSRLTTVVIQGRGMVRSRKLRPSKRALRVDMDPELFTLPQAKIGVSPRKETHLLAKRKKLDKGRNERALGDALEKARQELARLRALESAKDQEVNMLMSEWQALRVNLTEERPLTRRRGNRQEMLRPRLLSTLAKEKVRKMMLPQMKG